MTELIVVLSVMIFLISTTFVVFITIIIKKFQNEEYQIIKSIFLIPHYILLNDNTLMNLVMNLN
jgi:hypothetical protein